MKNLTAIVAVGCILVGCWILLSACYVTRPPTNALAVVNQVPPGAIRVGFGGVSWIGDCSKTPPSRAAIDAAEEVGANFLLLGNTVLGRCNAIPYAIR